MILGADNDDPDQTAQKCRLILAFIVCIYIVDSFPMIQSKKKFCNSAPARSLGQRGAR